MAFHIVSSPVFLCLRKIYLSIRMRNRTMFTLLSNIFRNSKALNFFCKLCSKLFCSLFSMQFKIYFLRRYGYRNILLQFIFEIYLSNFRIIFISIIKRHHTISNLNVYLTFPVSHFSNLILSESY